MVFTFTDMVDSASLLRNSIVSYVDVLDVEWVVCSVS
jgi:hypothetical protein